MSDNCSHFVTIEPFGRRLQAGHGANLAVSFMKTEFTCAPTAGAGVFAENAR